ncbi:MAG: hypothetical protein ACJA2Q_000105 [Pseudohongiellaceae bacterium]|jgi:hypothetical protein
MFGRTRNEKADGRTKELQAVIGLQALRQFVAILRPSIFGVREIIKIQINST